MCLGVPGQVVEPLPDRGGLAYARVEFGGVTREVCTACVPGAGPGDFVVVHAGVAITRLDTDEADRLIRDLQALAAAGRPEAP